MNTNKINEIIKKINDSLRDYSDVKFNVEVIKNDKFGFKLSISGLELAKLDEMEERNLLLSKRYGFTQNIVGMEFESLEKKGLPIIHRIVGFKTQNRSYPIITTEMKSGLSYKFSADSVKKKLGGNNLINRVANLENLLK